MAPAADMFEMGVKVQVLKRGTHVRHARRQALRTLPGVRARWTSIPAAERADAGEDHLPRPAGRRSGSRPRPSSASATRRRSSAPSATRSTRWRWSSAGTWASRRTGPTRASRRGRSTTRSGAARRWPRSTSGCEGSFLERPENRRVVTVALNILYGAAVLTRARSLAVQGVAVPAGHAPAGPARARGDRGPHQPVTDPTIDGRPRAHRRRSRRSSAPDPGTDAGPSTLPSRRSHEGDRHLNSVDPRPAGPGGDHRHGLPVPQGRGPRRATGPTSATASTPSPTCPTTHWRPEDYFDADPKAPDRTYARRGGFLDPVDFPAARVRHRPERPRSDRHHPAPRPAGRPPGARRRRLRRRAGPPFDRDRVSVILGVTGTLELVIPLGARLGHPIWRRALKEAGVADDIAEDVVQRHRRLVRRLAGELVPRPARQRRRRPDRQPPRPRRHQLRRRRRLRQLARRRPPRRCSNSPPAAATWSSPAASIRSTTSSCTCASARRRRCRRRGDARPFDAAGDGTILGEGLGVVVLKRLGRRRRDGDRVYAVIRAVGSSSDGKGNAVYAPSAAGQAKALAAGVRAGAG